LTEHLGEASFLLLKKTWLWPAKRAKTPSALVEETVNFLSEKFMSQHSSLRAASTSGAKRNVMKRFERIEVLKKRGQWKPGDRVTGLRKTKPDV